MAVELQGILPVLQIPYNEDFTVNTAVLGTEIDWVIQHGANGVVLAMASEIFRFTDAERDNLIAATVNAVSGRVPVIASVGGESIPQTVRHTQAAAQAGADGVMAIPPTLTNCDAAMLETYYETILAVHSGPVVVQDASAYLGNSIPLSVQATLFNRHPERIHFKPERQPIGSTISCLRQETGGKASIFEGMGGITLIDNYHRGIRGTMPGSEVPWAITLLWQALERNDMETAQRIQGPLSYIVAMLHNLDSIITAEKLYLREQGIFPNMLIRPPVNYTLDDETMQELVRLLKILQDVCA